jgi:uncharacterized protein (TIGR02186 family)
VTRIALAAALLAAAAAPAAAESLLVSLSSERVAITSNYTGSSVVVFGAIERDAQTVPRAGDYAVVVTVRGPRQSVVVREKEPFGPMWLNREEQRFPAAPAYIGVFASGPLAAIADEPVRRRLRLGLQAIVHAPDFTYDRGGRDRPFREALIRLKDQERLYITNEAGVTFLTPALFRASVPLPATAPPGAYEVEVALLLDGVALSRVETRFRLFKIGFEEQVGAIARNWSAPYGIVTAACAILFGWLASVIFRRD